MRNFKQNYRLKATPEEIYSALTNPFTIELWTGYHAVMNPVPGTPFEMWDGDICGENIEFIENKKIVQEWYFGEQPVKSIVTLFLTMKGNSTIIQLSHTNIPEEAYEDIVNGWNDSYFEGLKTFFK